MERERRPRRSRIVTRDSVRLIDRFDPFDDQIRSDPYPWYAALRDAAPVHYVQSQGFWVISRYDEVAFPV